MSVELNAIEKCASQLERVLVHHVEEISMYLLSEGFISDGLYQEVSGPALDSIEKVSRLVNEMKRAVKLQPSTYYKFINHFRVMKGGLSDAVNTMDAEYFDARQVQQASLSSDDIYKELFVIKDKWRSIAKSLKIPDDLLDRLVGIDDPLLEVIIHWLKGESGTSRSWDTVVSALKDSCVNEKDLADKIYRLYCHYEVAASEVHDSDITSGLVKAQLVKANEQKLFKRSELVKESENIKNHFAHFLALLQQDLSENDISTMKTHLVMYDKQLKALIGQCKSLKDILEVLALKKRVSFLDYELLKVLTDCGSDTLRNHFIDYKKKLQEFFESRTIERFTGKDKSCIVVIDDSIADKETDLILLGNRIKFVLGHKNVSLLHYENMKTSERESEPPILPSQQSNTASLAVSTSNGAPSEVFSKNETCASDALALPSSLSGMKSQGLQDELTAENATAIQEIWEDDVKDEYLQMLDSAEQLSSKSDFHMNAIKGDLPGIIELMERGSHNPMDKDENGCSVPQLAAAHGHLHIVKYFLDEHGFNPALADAKNYTLLHAAARRNHLPIVQYLLHEKEVEPLCYTSEGLSPFDIACYFGHDDVAMKLLPFVTMYSAEQAIASSGFYTKHYYPLNLAAMGGHLSIVEKLTSLHKFDPFIKDKTGNTPLHTAALKGHLEVVRYLATNFFSNALATKNNRGSAALHCAASNDHLEIVKYLIEEKLCDPALPGYKGSTVLHIAAFCGSLPLVKYLTDVQDHDLYCKLRSRYTPMHFAASFGHLSIIKFLALEKKCDVMCTDFYGMTPLHYAVHEGHKEVIEFIASFSASSHSVASVFHCEKLFGSNALHMAATAGNLEVVQSLVEGQGFSPSDVNKHNSTPLHLAAGEGSVSVVKYLTLKHNCDPLWEDSKGRNAFLVAARNGQLEVIQFLRSIMNCSPKMVDKEGCSALHLAAEGGHVAIVRFLIQNERYEPLLKNLKGVTPFHAAAEAEEIEVVKFYVSEVNCSPKTLDDNGCNVLHSAAMGGSLELVEYLVEQGGVDPSCLDESHQTPLHFASIHGHFPLVRYLTLEKKCNPLARDVFGQSPFIEAARMGRFMVVLFFTSILKDTAQITDNTGSNALHLAAATGSLTIIRHLIEDEGYSPSSLNKQLLYPLHYAISNGHLAVVEYFIADRGCDPVYGHASNGSFVYNVEPTLLHWAAIGGHLSVVKYLIVNCKCDPMIRSTDMLSPLHYAAMYNRLTVIQYYVEHLCCDPHVKNKSDRTPLHYATLKGHLETIKYLSGIKSSLDPVGLLLDDNRHLPIHYAASMGRVEAVKLLEHVNDIYAVDIDGQTCLHLAAMEGHLKAVQFFIEERSFDPEVKDFSNVTPLHLASWTGEVGVVSYLVCEKGCDPRCKDKACDTPLHWAASEGQLEVVRFYAEVIQCSLLDKGENNKTPLDYAIFYEHGEVEEYLRKCIE